MLCPMHATDAESALFQHLLHAAALAEARVEGVLAPYELSLAKLGVLEALAQAGEPLPLGQLAERIACVRSNVTQLVDRLEEEGLVRREPDAADRRVTRAALTAEGRRRQQGAAQAYAEAVAQLTRAAPPALASALRPFIAALERGP
jgi:DNA-binding MarR family transcriptional regulator